MEYNFIITNEIQKLISMAKQFHREEQAKPKIIEELIAQRYTIRQELSIQRQRDVKPLEYEEYNSYCEVCKSYAKELLGIE